MHKSSLISANEKSSSNACHHSNFNDKCARENHSVDDRHM